MKCKIMHESVGRVRVRLLCGRMTLQQADILEYYLKAQPGVRDVSVYDRTCDAVISYRSGRSEILAALCDFDFADEEALKLVPEHTSRALIHDLQTLFFQVPFTDADSHGNDALPFCKLYSGGFESTEERKAYG